jgi:hypothetical protein
LLGRLQAEIDPDVTETTIPANYSMCARRELTGGVASGPPFGVLFMTTKIVSGAAIAAAAVALVVSGAAVAPASAKKAAKSVECAGVNSCKGTSSCKTANSGCKGQNSCKGQGWLPAKSAAACEAKGGTVL